MPADALEATSVTDASFFSEVLAESHDRPVLVDFYAPWCGPCNALAPTLDKVQARFGETASVVKLDVDANPEATQTYGVRSLPTLVFFKDGQPVDQLQGGQLIKTLTEKLGALVQP